MLLKISQNRLDDSYISKCVVAYACIFKNFSSCFLIVLYNLIFSTIFIIFSKEKRVKNLGSVLHVGVYHMKNLKKPVFCGGIIMEFVLLIL